MTAARCGAAVACRAVLTVLAADPAPPRELVEGAVHRVLDDADLGEASAMFNAFRRGEMPVDAALGVLAEFGAVDDEARLTPLGRWARRHPLQASRGPFRSRGLPGCLLLRAFGTS